MPEMPNYLICPTCKGELLDNENSLKCQNCAVEYEKKWDIPQFSQNKDFYYCPTKKEWLSEKLDEYYKKIESDPTEWESLLKEIIDKIPDNKQKDEWIANLVDESRTAYKYLTSLNPEGHVLNFGSGWDNTTINLARTAKKVTAIDLTCERIQTLALKKKYYNLENIDLFCGGDRPYLPFKDNSFDTIFINGVLEWVASDWSEVEKKYAHKNKFSKAILYLKEVYGSHKPREIQKRFLKEMSRVLKDDGEMYIGIENRYSRLYFGKRPDHHSFIWFGSLYPRFIAHLVSLIRSQRPYLTFTYSVNGMKKLARDAGFNLSTTFGMEPMYRTPSNLFNLAHKNEIEFPRKENKYASSFLTSWLYKKTVTSYGYIATKKEKAKPWVELVVQEFLESQKLNQNDYQVKKINSNRKEKFTIFVEEKSNKDNFYVIKVPITDRLVESVENNYMVLEILQEKIKENSTLKYLPRIVPKPIMKSELNGQKYFVETGCLGTTAKEDKSFDTSALKELPFIIKEFNEIQLDHHTKESLLEGCNKKFNFLEKFLDTDQQRDSFAKLRSKIIGSIEKSNSKLYLRKSDFSLSNILFHGSHICGIIDFDEAGCSLQKSKNFAEFILSYSRNRQNMFWTDSILALQNKNLAAFPSVLEIEKTLKLLETDIDELTIAAQIAWINHVYYMVQFEVGKYSTRKLHHLFHKVLENISDTIYDKNKVITK